MKHSTPGAMENIQEALDLIQEAQRLLDRACQKLSPIRRGMDLSDKTFAMRERVHKHWYLIAKARNRAGMSLDSEPEILTEAEERERAQERKAADHVDGCDRDDLGPSPD